MYPLPNIMQQRQNLFSCPSFLNKLTLINIHVGRSTERIFDGFENAFLVFIHMAISNLLLCSFSCNSLLTVFHVFELLVSQFFVFLSCGSN